MKLHRNSQKRIVFEDACYFATPKTYYNYPYFREWIFCDLFVENLKLWKELKGFLLFGWVVIYDPPARSRSFATAKAGHIHLLFQPSDEFDISDVMFSIKKQFAHNVNRILGYNKTNIYPEGTEGAQALARLQCLQKKSDIDVFVRILTIRFRFKRPNGHSFPKPACRQAGRFKWQKSFHDHYMRNDWDFNDKLEYIAWNPDKHGLPADWPYVYTHSKYENLFDE